MQRLKESHSLPRPLFPRTRPELWRTLLLLIPLNLTVALLVWHYFPEARNSFIKEDRAVENMTAGLFALAFIAGTYNVFRVRGAWNRIFYLPIALLGAVGFLDELSWGERISRKHAPVFVSDGVKIDGVHDAAVLVDRVVHPFLTEYSLDIVSRYSFLLLLIAVWLGVSGVAVFLRRRFPALLFLIPAVACVFIGKYLDVREKIRIWVGRIKSVSRWKR